MWKKIYIPALPFSLPVHLQPHPLVLSHVQELFSCYCELIPPGKIDLLKKHIPFLFLGYNVFPHIVSAETILCWIQKSLGHITYDQRSQYIYMRKLFKGGNYSRAETIWGNTVPWKVGSQTKMCKYKNQHQQLQKLTVAHFGPLCRGSISKKTHNQ